MRIITINKHSFNLVSDNNLLIGSIQYHDNELKTAKLQADLVFHIVNNKPGIWTFFAENKKTIAGKMKVATGGRIILETGKQSFHFSKTAQWLLRFVLFNKEGEELLAIKPTTNWNLQAHDFILQVNDELAAECNSFLILQTIHCAICCMGMMYDKTVPPIVSVTRP